MRIVLTVDPEIPVPPIHYGGIERVVDLLVRGLIERGHDVTLCAHPGSRTRAHLVPYAGLRSQSALDALRNTCTVSRAAFHRTDIVHSFGRLAYLAVVLPTRIPKIMSYQRRPSLERVRQAIRLARTGSLVFTGCSEHISSQIRPFAPAFRVFNGVSTREYEFQPTVSSEAPLAFLGRLESIKGVHSAIEIAKRSGRRLVIAGNVEDERRQYFEDSIKRHLDGDRIRYIGPVNNAQKSQLLGRAAALLMPVEWDEPFGIVMAEAMACGTPVIGTRRGALPEIIDHEVTGFVCDDVSAMTAAVGRLDRIDRAACRTRCERHFCDRVIVDAYEELYGKHLAGELS